MKTTYQNVTTAEYIEIKWPSAPFMAIEIV